MNSYMAKEHCFNILQKMFPYLTEDDTGYVKELSEKLRKAQSKDEATLFAVNEFDKLYYTCLLHYLSEQVQ